MKFISLFLTLLALYWTWSVVHGLPDEQHQMHASIHSQFRDRIVNTIQEKFPEASNFRFDKLWTEQIHKDKIVAQFRYSFDLENVRKTMAGQAEFRNVGGEDSQEWKLSVRFDQDSLKFQESLTVSPGK